MSDFIKPYNNDASVGLLATPINTSAATRTLLNNIPVYRKNLSPIMRGVEVGMAHGYFLVGPFTILGPLRSSEVAPLFGYITTLGLIAILTTAMTIYGWATYQDEVEINENSTLKNSMLFSKEEWNQFTTGFFIGGAGGAGVVYLGLKYLPL